MSRTAATFLFLSVATALSVSACSSGDIAVGSSQSALQKKKDGSPTGNGTTCSWDEPVSSDGNTSSSGNGPYKTGDSFPSHDGCNTCSCTEQGIACTLRDCAPSDRPCTEEAKQCPDGSAVSRSGPRCEFPACPPVTVCAGFGGILCPSGQTCVDDPTDECELGKGADCSGICKAAQACQADAKLCPNGTSIGRTGPNCTFPPCP